MNASRHTSGGATHAVSSRGITVPNTGQIAIWNNAFVGINNLYASVYRGWVGQSTAGSEEFTPAVPDPPRIGTRGDYNLFNYQDAAGMNNYEISVAATTEGTANWAAIVPCSARK